MYNKLQKLFKRTDVKRLYNRVLNEFEKCDSYEDTYDLQEKFYILNKTICALYIIEEEFNGYKFDNFSTITTKFKDIYPIIMFDGDMNSGFVFSGTIEISRELKYKLKIIDDGIVVSDPYDSAFYCQYLNNIDEVLTIMKKYIIRNYEIH